jgi:hypothetical protein
MAVLLIATLAGCAGNAAPSGEDPAPEVASSSAAASVAPSKPPAVREPHTFVFSATGTAAVTSVTYELDGEKTTERSVSLPWRKVTDVPADSRLHTWRLTVKLRSGGVKLVGIKDGTVVGQSQVRGTGDNGSAGVSGEFRG